MESTGFEYAQPRQIATDLWEIRGEWKNKFGRRMTIIRLRDGGLILHSSIHLKQKDLDWLRSLGTVTYIFAPNTFHCSDAGWAAKTFPSAELLVPRSKIAFFESQGFKPKDVNLHFPSVISSEVKCIPMLGTKIEEAALLHVSSDTLVLCDLAFNMSDMFTGFEKIVMKWNKVGGQFGPSRLTKLIFTKDRRRLIDSYKLLLNEKFDRVIVNHGEILESGGKERLRDGIERIFGRI